MIIEFNEGFGGTQITRIKLYSIFYSVSGIEAATGINYNFIYGLGDEYFVAKIFI